MGWLDPNTWKPIADLADDWRIIIGSVVAVGGIITSVTRQGRKAIASVWRRLGGGKRRIADLRFVADDRVTFWSIGRLGTEEVTSISGTWHVTNVSAANVCLLRFRIRGENLEHMMISSGGQFAGQQGLVPARKMEQIDAHGIIRRKVQQPRQAFVADVIFTDNYGDDHRVRKVNFTYRGP